MVIFLDERHADIAHTAFDILYPHHFAKELILHDEGAFFYLLAYAACPIVKVQAQYAGDLRYLLGRE